MKIVTIPSFLQSEIVPYASVEIVREATAAVPRHTLQVSLAPSGVIHVAIVPVTPHAPLTPVVDVTLVKKTGGV